MKASFDFNNTNGLVLVNIDLQDGKTKEQTFKSYKKSINEGKQFWLFKLKQIIHKELIDYLHHRKLAYQYAGCISTDKILILEKCILKLNNAQKGNNYQFFIEVFKMRNNLLLLKPIKTNYWNEKIEDLLQFTHNILIHGK